VLHGSGAGRPRGMGVEALGPSAGSYAQLREPPVAVRRTWKLAILKP
jgi:hypothetical protein